MKTRSVLLPSLAAVLLAAIVGQAAAAEDEAAKVIRFGRIFAARRSPQGLAGRRRQVFARRRGRIRAFGGSRPIARRRRRERPGGGDHLRTL